MKAVTAQRARSNNALDLGTAFWLKPGELGGRTIDQLIAALEMTTTLTSLTVSFVSYKPTPENNRRIVEPLCNCLSHLRCRNEHHPLYDLTLRTAHLSEYGMPDVFEQFLIAARKYGGIYHLELSGVHSLSILSLVEFCHYNNNLKSLEVDQVSFLAPMSLPPNRPQDSSAMVTLEKLCMDEVSFENSTASTAFADFIARMTVQALVLCEVTAENKNDEITARILSEIKFPSVKQLELSFTCRFEHFKAALEAGTTSLIELDVCINYGKDDYVKRLALLTNYVRRAVQLSSLTFSFWVEDRSIPQLPRKFLRAIEACATVTRLQVPDNVRLRQDIATRNEELAGFLASPSTYPTENLLGLMRQFDNCPTGRYMLVRCLPVVLSFEKIKSTDSSATEPNSKERKTE